MTWLLSLTQIFCPIQFKTKFVEILTFFSWVISVENEIETRIQLLVDIFCIFICSETNKIKETPLKSWFDSEHICWIIYNVKVLLFVVYQFSWFLWVWWTTKFGSQQKKEISHSFEWYTFEVHECWNLRTDHFYLNHENWYIRIKVLPQ